MACDATRPVTLTPSLASIASQPPPSGQPRKNLTAGELAGSIQFRTDFGLRSDEAWIRDVAADPNADWTTYAVPLTSAELHELNKRALTSDAISAIVTPYGSSNPNDWAGDYIDNKNGGTFVVQFSAHLEEHRRALLREISPGVDVEFRLVRWSLRELQSEADRLRGTDAWFRSLPAVLTGYGVDVPDGTVLLKVSTSDPDVAGKILAHFNWPPDLVTVDSDGTGALLIDHGTLTLVIRDRGRPVSGVQCIPISDLTGQDGQQMPVAVTDKRGICVVRDLAASGYRIRVQRDIAGPGFEILGFGRAVVIPNKNNEVTIDLN
ncbi:MAG: carboxypeptidase-like regulatory domain-containing protein [Candidatus Limnocylindrales bacterium]